MAKHVLWVLADAANDTGACWPSMAALREWTCLSERAVQGALRLLEQAGAMEVVRGGGRGRTQRYVLRVGGAIAWQRPEKTPQVVRGIEAETPHVLRGNGETPHVVQGIAFGATTTDQAVSAHTPHVVQGSQGGETPQDMRGNAEETPQVVRGIDGETPQEVHPEPVVPLGRMERVSEGGGRAARAPRQPITSRILPDWTPSPADAAFAAERGLDVALVAEQFRDYWLSIGGERSRKADWSATWRVWVRKEAERGGGKMGAPSRPARGRPAAPDPWLNGGSIFDEPAADGRGPVIDGTAERWP